MHYFIIIIIKNFWGFCKRVVEKPFRILPSFSRDVCKGYFRRLFSPDSPNHQFSVPNWFPSLPQPSTSFVCEPPSYEKVTGVIRRMKASGSPCPLDQISVICFKRCPFLRTMITRFFSKAWRSGNIPNEWKKACTNLVHKKVNSDLPSNFRPITLETPTPLRDGLSHTSRICETFPYSCLYFMAIPARKSLFLNSE